MRVTIVSRIFSPEPAAASFRLAALAEALVRRGHEVSVRTSTYRGDQARVDSRVRVKRAPVLRDSAGYVRGYAQYMSFDIPLFFRLLLGKRCDVFVVEPPPTTGLVVRLIAAIRRTPYVYYAADIWSDASRVTGAWSLVVDCVRVLEIAALRGARTVLAVSDDVVTRLAELGIEGNVELVGNGVDTALFQPEPTSLEIDGFDALEGRPYLVYAGTASEVHGAGIFLEAFIQLARERPECVLVFIGQGAERAEIERSAGGLTLGSVHFEPRLPPKAVAAWLRGAVASLASVRPGQGYDFAFPTKIYASVACGTPVIYAGVGPGREFVKAHHIGEAVEYDVSDIVAAMRRTFDDPAGTRRRAELAAWARSDLSLDAVAERASGSIESPVQGSNPGG